jgi:hypothetical protein
MLVTLIFYLFYLEGHITKKFTVSGHALFTSTPRVFLLNILINKAERSIHFYWIHFLNEIVRAWPSNLKGGGYVFFPMLLNKNILIMVE